MPTHIDNDCKKHTVDGDSKEEQLGITAPTQKWRLRAYIKLCASIKVSAWLTVKCF